MSGDHWLAEVLDWFDQVDQYLPGSSSIVGEFLYGKVPQANDDRLHDLADAWAAARDQVNSFAEDIYRVADPILQGWGGDGGAMSFQQGWQQYVHEVQQAVDAYSGMADMTSGFALEVETEKFMTALNLLFLAYTLITIIATLVVSFGASALAAPGAFAVAREAIAMAAREALEKIAGLGGRLLTKDVLKNVVARATADKIAGQVFKDVIRKEMRTALTDAVDAGARKALIRGAYQMRKELADKLAAQIAKDWGAKTVENVAGRTVVEDISDEAIQKLITDTVSDTFGKELVKYFVPKVTAGAVFMGGQNLIVQSVEVIAGDKSSVNIGDVAMSAVQGGLMGGLMGGRTYAGQMATGALAGLSTAALADGVAVLSGHGADVNWGADLLRGAGSGAVMAGFFHVQHGTDVFGENLSIAANDRIGQGTHLLLDPRTGAARLDIHAGDLHLDRQVGGVTMAERGDTTAFFDPSGATITADRATDLGYRGGDTGSTAPARPGTGSTAPARPGTGSTTTREPGSAPPPREGGPARPGASRPGPPPDRPSGEHADQDRAAGQEMPGDQGVTDGPAPERPAADGPHPVGEDRRVGEPAAPAPDDHMPPPRPDPGPAAHHAGPGHHPGPTHDGSARPDATARDDAARDGATRDDAARDGATRDDAARDGAARDDAARPAPADPVPEQRDGADPSGAVPPVEVDPDRIAFADPPVADHPAPDMPAGFADAGPDLPAGNDPAPVAVHPPGTGPAVPVDVEVTGDGRVWSVTLPADHAGDAAAAPALDARVADVLRAAGASLNWSDGRPPRIEIRAEHGIDARVARHLEHLPAGDDSEAAGGIPARPRVRVIGPRGHGDPIRLDPAIREQDGRDRVPYLDAEQRGRYHVRIVDGRVYDQDDVPLHGHYVYATEPGSHRVYAMEWSEEGRLGAKHSTLLAGGDVLSAGEMRVDNGRVVGLDNSSGHYRPGADHLFTQRDVLADQGVDVSGADLRVLGPERTPRTLARGQAAFDRAIDELNRPGEIDGVRRIEVAPAGRHTDPDHPGTTLRVTTTDGRVVEVDAGTVHDYLTSARPPRPDIPDADRLGIDRDRLTPESDLAYQGADLLRDRIHDTLGTDPDRPAPDDQAAGGDRPAVADHAGGDRPAVADHAGRDRPAVADHAGRDRPAEPIRTPRALSDLDRTLADRLGEPPLLGGDRATVPLEDPSAAVSAARAISDARIHEDVAAAGLPPDRAADLSASLIERRDAVIDRYQRPPHPDEVRRMTDAIQPFVRPDMSDRELYDTLREQAYRKTVGYSTGLTVPEAARALDDALAAEHGSPGAYARKIDDYLATPEGRAYHDDLVHLDLATSHAPHVDPDASRFREPGPDAVAAASARQGHDWSPAQRDALGRYADTGAHRVDLYLRTDGAQGGPGRPDAFKIQSAMRPTDVDLRLHGGLDLSDLGLADRGGLPGVVDAHISVNRFLRVSADESGTSVRGDVRIVVEAPAGTHAVWLGDTGEHGTGDLLLAAGTDLHVTDLTRIGTDRYELRVRVTGYDDPAGLTGRVTHAVPGDGLAHNDAGGDHTHRDDAGGHHPRGDGDSGDHLHRDDDSGRSNADVWRNGGDAPLTLDEVHRVAGLIGVDLAGVRVELVTEPAEIHDLDERGLAATTPVAAKGAVIRLGPAAFADRDTLAATIAHEYTHVEQLRSGVLVSADNRAALEREAYASERPALDRMRIRLEGDTHDDPVLGGEGLRLDRPGRSAGVGLDPGGSDRAGDGVGGRDGRADEGGQRGVREPGRPADRPGDPAAGAHQPEPGGARDGAGRRGQPDHPGVRLPGDLPDGRADAAATQRDVLGSDAGGTPVGDVRPVPPDLGLHRRDEVPVRHGLPGEDAADLAGRGGADRAGGSGDGLAERGRDDPDHPGRAGGGEHVADRSPVTDDLTRPAGEPDQDGGPSAHDLERRALAGLDPADRQKIEAAVGEHTRRVADDALAQLRRVADRLDSELGGGGRVRMVGDAHHVKGAGSLARKYLDVSATTSIDEFLGSVNDLIRFSMELPEDGYTGSHILSVLHDLDALGYRSGDGGPLADAADARNFWRAGNRFYGLNVTMREPGGHLMEVQFPTERSWAAGKRTHDWYEIVRQSGFDFDTRVDAFLRILAIDRESGLPEHTPTDQAGLPVAKRAGFAEWAGAWPRQWQRYVDGLAEAGRTFDDVLAGHGLTRDDIPRAEAIGLADAPRIAADAPVRAGDAVVPDAPDRAGDAVVPGDAVAPDRGGDDDLGRLFGRQPGEPDPPGELRPGLDFRTAEPPLPEGMPADPNASFGRLREQVSHIAREQASLAESLRGDPKYWFAAVYHHVTSFELAMIDDGRYTYPIMKLQEVVAFDHTYEVNMDRWLHGRRDAVEPNWRLAFQAAERAPERFHPLRSLEVLDAMLPSMKAHIEFDLPRAIAAVYEHDYAGTGIPFDAFKPDFDRMQPVFDDASAALLPEIAAETMPVDPGRYAIVARHGFPFIYDVARARQDAWHRAGLIVSGHARGIDDQAGMQRRIDAYRVGGAVFSGHSSLTIAGHRVAGYDWNHQPGLDPVHARPEPPIPVADVVAAVVDRIGAHSPDLASVVRKLLDDEHPLNVTASLRSGARHERVLATIEDLARGEALRPYDGSMSAFLADHPGHGALFDRVPPEINRVTGADGIDRSRLGARIEAMKAGDGALTVGARPTPAEAAALGEYAARLRDVVKPAVDREIAEIAADVRADADGPVEVNSRPKDASGLIDKVNRMVAGRPGAPGRGGYQVGDIVDAVGARITVADMRSLERLYAIVVDRFGVGDGGRILEIDNMYAAPKAKNPNYRVIPMVVAIEVAGRAYTFELQLTTLRASVAADIEHNSLYKPYITISPEEASAVLDAFTEAAARDQQEAGDE